MKGYWYSRPRMTVRLKTVLCGLLLGVCLSCGQETRPPDSPAVPESFTFFEVGANTPLTDGLRSDLRGKLGKESISGRNVMNLEINYSGFLREHFPDLDILNRELNGSGGIRVEHDTVTLMYRHMSKQVTPFDFVELIFDANTRKPLVIRIRAGRDEVDILDTLKDRYGEPKAIAWGDGGARAYSWDKNGDVLILSAAPNPVGRREFSISMYYVNSIKAMAKREKAARRQERQREDSVVKDAFSKVFQGLPHAVLSPSAGPAVTGSRGVITI